MMTLAELSKLEKDTLRKSVMDHILEESPVMHQIQWETLNQLSTTIVQYQALPSAGFRKVNEGYAESTGTFKHRSETVSLFGLDIDTDIAVARAKNTVADARAIQQKMALKAVSMAFNNLFINGDPVADEDQFPGLKYRVDALYADGFTGQKINLGLGGAIGILKDADTQNAFLDKIDELIYAVDGHSPDAMFMHRKVLLGLRSILRRRGLLDMTQDMFGRRIDVYSNVKMYDIGATATGTDIITITEDTHYSSIYAVKFSIGDEFWGIQEYPIEVRDLGEIDAKPVYRTRVDWPLGLAMSSPRCVARLYNVRPDATAA